MIAAVTNPDNEADMDPDELAAVAGASVSTIWTTSISYVARSIAEGPEKLMQLPEGDYIKTPYYAGQLRITFVGVPTTIPVGTTLGTLRVTYSVTLSDPIYDRNVGTGVLDCAYNASLFGGDQVWLGQKVPMEAVGNNVFFNDHHHPRLLALHVQGINPVITVDPASTCERAVVSAFGNATDYHMLLYLDPKWGADMVGFQVPGVSVVNDTRLISVRSSSHSGLAP